VLVAGDADFVPAAKLGREHAHSLTANMAPDLLQSLKDDAEAFEVIAKAGDDEELFHLIAPIVAGIDLTQGEFNQWINEYKYQRPAFWGNAEQQPADKTVRHRRTKHVQWHIQRAVDALAKTHGGKFPPTDMPVFERDRLIRSWLAGDDEPAKPPSERALRDYFKRTADLSGS
jgi:hypothetical protein